MVTTGITNAGFIILLFSDKETISEINNWDNDAIIAGVVLAIVGGIFSGFEQKNIYFPALNGFAKMVHEGDLDKIRKKDPYLFHLAKTCAYINFAVNFGLGWVGMGVFLASGGAPIIVLSFLFALGNALLVYFTSLEQIQQGISVKKYFKENPLLTLVFAVLAIIGLMMTFLPGANELRKVFTDLLGNIAGYFVISFSLFFSVLTEAFYSLTKASHRAKTIAEFIEKPQLPSSKTLLGVVNSCVNGSLGAESGEELLTINKEEDGDDNNENTETANTPAKIGLQTMGGTTSFVWSSTCSAPIPKTLTTQFNAFIEKTKKLSNPTSAENASNQYRQQLS
ncbi:MAG: hypothetical protein WC748_01380 [Legionellales bacterium]|jgi:hypothetical protein